MSEALRPEHYFMRCLRVIGCWHLAGAGANVQSCMKRLLRQPYSYWRKRHISRMTESVAFCKPNMHNII